MEILFRGIGIGVVIVCAGLVILVEVRRYQVFKGEIKKKLEEL